MAQAGLGQDNSTVTMRDRSEMFRDLLNQGHSSTAASAQLDAMGIPPMNIRPAAGLGDEAAEDDGMGFGELLANYGPRTAISGALEGVSGIAEDYIGDGMISDALQGAADTVGPTDEQEAARAKRAAEKGFVGTVGDAITQEAGTLAGTIAAGAAAGTAFGPGVGTLVGGILGAGVGVARMYDQGRDNVVAGKVAEKLGKRVEDLTPEELAKHSEGVELTADEKKRVAAVGALGAMDAFPASKVLKMIRPQQVAGIATKHFAKTAGKEALKTGVQEGSMEFAQELGTMLLTDSDLQADIAKLPKKDILALGQHIAETKGEELAISFLAGFGLGGPAGAVGGGVQQSAANKYNEKRIKDTAALAEARGIDVAALEEISKDPERVGQLQAGISEIQALQESVNALQASYDTADAELKGVIGPELEASNKRLEAKIDATYGEGGLNIPGFRTTGQVKELQKVEKEAKVSGLKDRAKAAGITPTDDATLEQNEEILGKLEEAKAATEDANRKLQNSFGSKKENKNRKALEAAVEAEADLRADVASKVEGKDPAEVRKSFLEQRKLEEEAQRIGAGQEEDIAKRQARLEAMDPEEGRRAAEALIRRQAKNPDKKKQQELAKKKRLLQKQIQDPSISEAEIDKLENEITGLESMLGTANPAVVAAERFLAGNEGDVEAQSQPQGGEAVQTPSDDTATSGEEAQAGDAAAVVTTEPKAAATKKAPARAEVEAVAAQPVDMTNVRQERLKDYDAARRSGDPAEMTKAAEAIIGDLGIPVNAETVAAFNGGRKNLSKKKRAEAAAEAAGLADMTLSIAAGRDAEVVPANDPRRQGRDITRQNRWQTLIDDVDPNDDIGAHEDFLREWTAESGFEASATYDADGNLLGIGTNRHRNEITLPSNGWNQPGVTMTHTHPSQTPMSSADILVLAAMNPEGTSVRAVLPDGQVTEIMRGEKPLTREAVQQEFGRLRDALDEVIPSGLGLTAAARVKQEAFLRHMDAEGYILYAQPMSGFSAAEENLIYGAIDRAAGDTGVRDDVGAGTPPPEGRPDGAEGTPVAATGAGTPAAAGLDLARTADQEPLPGRPADPERIADLTKPFIDEVMAGPKNAKGKLRTDNLTHLKKAIATGELTQAGMNAGLNYAANAVSNSGTEASTVVLQAARLMFPKAKITPTNFVKKKVTRKNGKPVVQLNMSEDWKFRMNAAYQFLNRVGQEEGMGFEKIKLPLKQKNGFFDFEATHFTISPEMEAYLQMSPPESALFTRPMEDPNDTTDILRHADTNKFTPEAIDRMRKTAEYMQANTYYLDQEAIAALTPDDLISDKKLGEQLLKRNDAGQFVDKDGTLVDDLPQQETRDGTMTDHPAKKFIKTQRYRQTKKLAMLKRMAAIHGDQPIGFRYRVDDKGRIYADGAFTPQTGDYVKGILRVDAPDGPKLKDMPMVDHSASGWQVATLMTRDKEAANWFNLGSREGEQSLALQPDYKKRDMYDTLMTDLKAEIIADANNPADPKKQKLAQLFKERVFDTNQPFGKVQIKPAVIAVNYAGGRANFQERLMEVYGDLFKDVPATDRSGLWGYTSAAAYNQLRAKAPETMKFQDWAIEKLASIITQVEGKSNALKAKPQLQFSVGLDGTYAKIKPVTKDVKVKATDGAAESVEQSVDVPTAEVDANATARSIFSQIIQGFDASILHRAMDIYKQNGDDFVTSNHDSYTTPQGQAGRMAAATRQAMKEIMTEAGDPAGRLRAEIEAQAAEFGAEIEGLNDPEVFNPDGSFKAGDYDLNDLDTAVPVFVENAGDVAPALTDLQGNVLPEAPAFSPIGRGIDFDAADTGALTGVQMDTSLPKAAQYAQDNQLPTGRDFKVQLQEQALAAQAREGIDLTQDTPENIERLADFVFEDARAAAVNNSNAIGWYGRTVDAAKAELRKLHPELTPGSDAEFQFSWALAVTSNGLKVDKNFQLAEQAYVTFKETGKFPTDIGIGEAAQQINSGLAMYQQLVDKLGSVQAAREFMVKRQPVKDIKRISGIGVSKEGVNTILPGAVILGPKIGGGFFSNLYGNFNELTMDRWFTRTVMRWRGGLIKADPVNLKKKQGQMRQVLKGMDPAALKQLRGLYEGSGVPIRKTMSNANLDALAMETAKRSAKPEWRARINDIPGGSDVRKVGNMHAVYLDGQVEEPGGSAARNYLREVFNRGLDRLRAEPDMSDLTMADLQALLWYPEKRLYDTAKKPAGEEVTGYESDEAPDYATAAAKLVRDRLGRTGGNGAGPVTGGAGAEPSFGPPLANGIDSDAGAVDADGGPARAPRSTDEYGDNDVAGVGAGELSPDVQEVDAASYSEALDAAIPFMGDFAAQVSRVPDDPDIRRYTLDDGYSGFAIDGDNIIGVFSSPGAGYSGAAGRILQAAIAAGGRRLDGFDTFLPKVYADNGFRAVARLPFNREYAPHVDKGAAGNWNYETMAPFNNGEPDVVFMVYDPANASPDTDQVIGDYQDGIDIQDTELEGTNAGDVAGGTGGRQPVGSGDVAGAGAPVARGIDEWLGSKPDTTDAKVKGEVDYAVGNGRTSPNAALAFIRHSPLFGYDTIMNEATKRDGLDFGQEFFKAHSNFTKGMGAKLAQLSRTVPDSQVPFYLDMVKAQKNDHIKKLIEGINRGTIQVSDIDPVTKTYKTSPPDTQRVPIAAGVDAPIAMGMDVTARVQAAPAKRGIAQPVETKTPERVASAVFDGAADPKGTFDNLLKGMGKMSRAFGRQVMNRQAGLKQIEQLAGMGEASIHDGMSRFAQMMSASTGRTAAMMSFGAPVWNAQKKIYEIDRSTKGLDQIFQFNGVEDYQNFQGWAYAKRDRDLMAKGKSARMTDDLRAEFEAIPAADKARYDNMLDEYRKYNQALRKLMLDSGLINQKQMDALAAENEYVPMYRQFDDPEALGLGTFFGKDGFSHPDPNIKKMGKDVRKVGEPGGGDFGDLIEGIHNNAVAVMHAASQNLAHQQIYNFMTNNLPHEVQKKVSARKLGKKEKKAARLLGDQDAVKFLENGKEVYWRAQGDPEWTGALQMALAGLSPAQLDGIDKALKGFNSFQRAVITSTPAFAIRSVVRDMGQAYVQSGTNPAAIAQKNAGMLKESWDQYSESTQALMMASGVAGYQMQGMPDVDAESFRKKVGAQESGRLHQIRQAFGQYERVVGSTELGARAALYEGELGRTGDEASAAYEALNMIDYNRKGASPAIQKLSYMILFLNPRLQGLYRLFETTTGDGPTKYAKVSASLLARGAVLGGLAMAARALTAMDDEAEEEYRALTQADRATYFHIPLHGMGVKRFLRLPKPFEVGAAFATLPVAGIDAVAMGPEGMDDLGAMAMHVFMETFSFNPTPQAIRPVAEVMLNRNMFTGREIEGMRLQNLPKSERIDAQTTGIAQVVSKYLTGSGISPAMMQHLMSGYLGPLGMLGVNTADATLAGAGIVPDKSAKVDGIFGGLPTALKIPTDFTAKWLFSSTGAERGTRYIGEFYDLHTQIKQYTSAINEAKRVGDLDKVTDLVNRSKELRRLKPYMNKVNTQMSELNRQMRIAQNSPKLTDEQRQERMAKINLRKNKIARDAIERAYEMGVM